MSVRAGHPTPIAITGMHRSGTSMITRALLDSGLHLVGTGADELIEATEDNPEGFWENKAIRDCNDELLEASGGAWDNPPVLPPVAVDDPRVAHVAEMATAALAALREHDHWGFKDPRVCLTAAYWLDLEPELRFVICVRHPIDVALSLKRRNQNSYSLGLGLWERYYATVLDLVPAERRIVTHYDTFFVDPEGEMARLCTFAGLEPATPRVRSDLRHHATGIDLGDAGASDRVRTLYAELCREAGALAPRQAPRDEGRVRRLILDGAVAQRHADQRQAAIDRLQEREEEFRAAHAKAEVERRERLQALEQAHRDRVRELEAKVVKARLAAIEGEAARTLAALRESVARIDQRTRRAEARSVTGVLGRAARAAARRLPPSAQQSLRRGRRLAQRATAEPGPTARVVRQRALREARAQATRLPPPAQQVLRRGRAAYRRATAEPVPTAKAVVRRLPGPAQRLARHAWVASGPTRHVHARHATDPAPKAAPTPKGPAPRLWKDAYEALVRGAWTGTDPWLVVAPGSPTDVRDARSPRARSFPDTRGGRPLADDLSHIAHLEALRYGGHRHLVLAEGSRPWFRQQTELRDHVVRTYRTLADEPGAAAVFDLRQPAEAATPSLRAAIDELARGTAEPPAVLDCTGLDLRAELPDLAVFTPPAADGRLPYLDCSVDVVVVEDGRDPGDAARVARLGVIAVTEGGTGAAVRSVDGCSNTAEPASPRVLLWAGPAPDPRWDAALAERVEQAGAALLLAPIDVKTVSKLDGHDVVVALETHVLPLPGAIRAAAAAATADPASAVAGKVLRRDGSLESAGGTVFFDRSVALIAGSSAHVRAPWHDYVRPVCWAPGLVAATTPLWEKVSGTPDLEGRAYLREWCAAMWAQGGAVAYHPDVAAVRVAGDGGEPSIPLEASAWQRVLDLRPARPTELHDGAWRYLLARDDVEACRG
jgi:Sulfotransferase family